jgi:D-inositol-3-phosphate glycosyltransferase
MLTPPDDHVQLAAHLQHILTDPHVAYQMGRAARVRAERYGWSTIGCDILDVYRSLVRATSTTHACAC